MQDQTNKLKNILENINNKRKRKIESSNNDTKTSDKELDEENINDENSLMTHIQPFLCAFFCL